MEQRKRILIVEDEPIIAVDLNNIMRNMGHHVVARAFNSERALDLIAIHEPDLILLDINIDGSKDGIEVAEIIQKQYEIPFIFITSYSDAETLDRAKVTMPYGYIVKPFNERDIISTVEMVLFRFVNKKDYTKLDREKINGICNSTLTNKEFELLEDIVMGLTNTDIATKKFISINTVKTHAKNLYMKLQVNNRAAAIAKVSQL